MRARRIIVGCWLIALVLIFWQQQKSEQGVFPPAYRVGGAAITYTSLLLLAAFPPAEGLAIVFSLAWTVGLAWRGINATKVPTGFAPAHASAAQRAPAPPAAPAPKPPRTAGAKA